MLCHMMTVFGKQVVDIVRQRVIIAKLAPLRLYVTCQYSEVKL